MCNATTIDMINSKEGRVDFPAAFTAVAVSGEHSALEPPSIRLTGLDSVGFRPKATAFQESITVPQVVSMIIFGAVSGHPLILGVLCGIIKVTHIEVLRTGTRFRT